MFKNDEVCDLVQIDLTRVRKIRAALVQPDAVQGLADTFSALGDPTRVRILDALSHGELCVCDLAAVLRVSQSAVSHQLRLLRGLRLVRPRRDGRVVSIRSTIHIISLFKARRCSTSKKSRSPQEPPGRACREAARDERRPRDRLRALRPGRAGADRRIRGWFRGLAAAGRRGVRDRLVHAVPRSGACRLHGSHHRRVGIPGQRA
jgi:DNA-binding transcriptional ArsR family regulator